tara:strand:- start:4 stop:468 length:465 start_codon:yes stop_codon:yes gene_type:complete
MISLSSFITLERVLQGAHIKSKKRAIETLSQLLGNTDTEQATASHIYQSFYARERIGSTAMGHGVVMPHCRSDRVSITQVAVLTLNEPLAYDSPDSEPVDIFIGLVFPEHVKDVHLSFLSELAKMMRNQSFRAKVREAKDNESLYALFLDFSII